VSQRSNGYFARNGRLQRIKCAPARAEDRARVGGTPDSLQDLSGAPPDSQAGPQVRAPTVGTQRPGDVAVGVDIEPARLVMARLVIARYCNEPAQLGSLY
jgi:hypothetical protein